MNQDMIMLNEQLGQMRLQVETLQRQQAQMQADYEKLLKQQQALATSLNTFLADTENKLAALPARDQALKDSVNKQIADLAKQTDAGFKAITDAMKSQPVYTPPKKEFPQDYPETGFPHVVQSGETISGIARKYGAKINDVMNANGISDAKGLKAGETIFVPVAQ